MTMFGAVNGKPLRQSGSQYSKTGIQCGNPKMARGRETWPSKYMGGHYEAEQLDAPGQPTETEGERQLKRLLDKQLTTKTTLQEQFAQHRSFASSSTFSPLSDEVRGAVSLQQFCEVKRRKDHVDSLRQYGLTEAEIRLQLNAEGEPQTKCTKPTTSINPDALQTQLDVIEEKIKAKNKALDEPTEFRGTQYVSRHEMEIERSLKPNSVEAQLLQKLMTRQKVPTASEHPDDPINHIQELEQRMFGHLKVVKASNNKKKRKKRKSKGLVSTNRLLELSDKTSPEESTGIDEHDAGIAYCALKPVPEEDIIANRLTVDEIKQIPQFANYEVGIPSKTLYLKNLASNIGTCDLEPLFSRFQLPEQSAIGIRVMQGALRGQAFVTLPGQDVAAAALALVNGYRIKGKPLVIQYGHRE